MFGMIVNLILGCTVREGCYLRVVAICEDSATLILDGRGEQIGRPKDFGGLVSRPCILTMLAWAMIRGGRRSRLAAQESTHVGMSIQAVDEHNIDESIRRGIDFGKAELNDALSQWQGAHGSTGGADRSSGTTVESMYVVEVQCLIEWW